MPDYNPNSIWSSRQKKYEYLSADEERRKSPAKKPAASGGSKGIVIAIIIGIGALIALGGLYYLLRPLPPQNVTLAFSNPSMAQPGDPFMLTVSYANHSGNTLQNGTLLITLPDGAFLAGQAPGASQRVIQQAVGTLAPGQAGSSTLDLIMTGSPDSVAHVAARFAYGVGGSQNGAFETGGETDFAVGQPVLGVTVNAPTSIFSGQNFDASITYANNADHALLDAKIQLKYPSGFVFQKSSLPPADFGNDVWDLGTLPAGASGTITVSGSLVGQDKALYSIVGNATVDVQGQAYTVASPAANLAIAASPLSIGGTLNGSPDYIAKAGDTLSYVFTYSNNSSTTFQNVAITATLAGAMFDFKTLQSKASFNSLTNTLTWYPANTPELASVAPGQSGQVTVIVGAKQAFPIRFFGDKNYILKARAKIQSATVPPGTTAAATVSVMDLQNKVGGSIALAAGGYYHEAKSGGISNSGPYPPRVEQPTTYTVHWRITDYATDAENVAVTATLQSGTACTGQIKSNVPSSTPVCNPANGQITWQIPFIAATTGVINPPAEAIFQVKNTPAVNQLGDTITLLGPSTITATDAFTSSTLSASAPEIKTDLPDDAAITAPDRSVAP